MTSGQDPAARWARVQDLLHEALALPHAARVDHLRAACAGDDLLYDEVQSLLVHVTGGALGEPDDPTTGESAVESFGPYRVSRVLGHGGMGTVYLAEREGSGFTQLVALKLLRPDLLMPPHLVPVLERRFAQERQILARLEHPGIARLIDGGYTPGGQAYLAMEYVEGQPLLTYATSQQLGVRARLELFLQVCEAVQYAHRQLVIHRDLKPSNILVTTDGNPKLLDFGIATFVEAEEATAGDQPTGAKTGAWLTPAYASPEQVRRERITTLSDLYSLGVLLYELLAGVRPYEVIGLSPAAVEEVVCRRVPERPSMRVVDRRLARLLRGDLDTIVLKAVAKEPERRYGSVQELADDLRRHLRREGVHARPDSIGYRTSTFLRRNRSAVAASLTVLIALIGGLAATAWQATTAQRARQDAEAALAQSEEVTAFLIGLFEASDPQQEPLDPTVGAAILERGVARADELADQPLLRARLLDALGMVFVNLGRYDDAHELVGQALGIRMGRLGPTHPDVALSLRHLGWTRRALGDYTAAEAMLRQALSIQRATLPGDDPAIAETMSDLAFVLPYLGELGESEVLYQLVVASRRRTLGDTHPAVADALFRVAAILRLQGLTPRGESVAREALTLREQALGPEHYTVGGGMIALADFVAEDSTRLDDAERLYRDGLGIQRRALGDHHIMLAHGLGNLAYLLRRERRYDEAYALMQELLTLRQEQLGVDHPSVAGDKESIADLLAEQGRLADAIALRREGLAGWRRTLGPHHPSVAGSLDGLARLYSQAGAYQIAESLLVEGLEIRRRANGPRHALVGIMLTHLGEVNTQRGHFAEAERQLLEANDIVTEHVDPAHATARATRQALVSLYEAWDRPADADRWRF